MSRSRMQLETTRRYNKWKACKGLSLCSDYRRMSMKRNFKRTRRIESDIHFEDFALLKKAMIHSSYVNEKHLPKYECNERLEFLGDAVLELVSSEFLFLEHPTTSGRRTNEDPRKHGMRTGTGILCTEIELGEYLLLGKGEDATGGRKRESVTSDAMEALIGAIYLDGGFANAKEFIHRFILKDMENKKLFFDSKTILQEIVQATF